MSEISSSTLDHDPLQAAYWNVLYKADPGHQFAYVESILEQYNPDSLVLTECPSELYERIAQQYPHVYYNPTIKEGDIWEGMLAYTKQPTEVTPFSPWPRVESRLCFGLGKIRSDDREFLGLEIQKEGVAKTTVIGIHVTHYHHIWASALARRRRQEWEATANQIVAASAQQEDPAAARVVVMGDTNTVRDRIMAERLGLDSTGGAVLKNEGDRSWGYGPRAPRTANIDKVGVTRALVGRVVARTLPHRIGGIPNPSDHRAILAVVK